jgi:PhnB protein
MQAPRNLRGNQTCSISNWDLRYAYLAMTQLHPYINFGGRCREAMTFYKDVFRGELTLATFGEFGMPMPELKDNIMHAELKSNGLILHASDGQPHHPVTPGNNVSLSLQQTDVDEQTRVFDALADGGQVLQPLADGPWGARFGMLIDRFGLQWMLNCPKT